MKSTIAIGAISLTVIAVALFFAFSSGRRAGPGGLEGTTRPLPDKDADVGMVPSRGTSFSSAPGSQVLSATTAKPNGVGTPASGAPISPEEKQLVAAMAAKLRLDLQSAAAALRKAQQTLPPVKSAFGRRWATMNYAEGDNVVSTTIMYLGNTNQIAEIEQSVEDQKSHTSSGYTVLLDAHDDPTRYRNSTGCMTADLYPGGAPKELKLFPETHRYIKLQWDQMGNQTSLQAVDLPRGRGVVGTVYPPSPGSARAQWEKRLGVTIDGTVVEKDYQVPLKKPVPE